jgi:hypothetical protein
VGLCELLKRVGFVSSHCGLRIQRTWGNAPRKEAKVGGASTTVTGVTTERERSHVLGDYSCVS